MTFRCAHTQFANAINDPQSGYIGTGNVVSNTQHSTFVRAFSETDSNGWSFPAGRLRDHDLSLFAGIIPHGVASRVKAITTCKSVILYRFRHHAGRRVTEHGWLITTTDHVELARFVTGPTWKSEDVMRAVAKALTVRDTSLAA
jgi:hypothetical protein